MKKVAFLLVAGAFVQPATITADVLRELPLSASNCAIAIALNVPAPVNCQNIDLGQTRGIVIRLGGQATTATAEELPKTQDIVVQQSTSNSPSVNPNKRSNYAAAESKDGYFIHFAFNSANLEPQFKDHLKRLSTVLTGDALSTACLRVVGHTDAVGSESYNMGLSEKRAKMVADYLAKEGKIDAARMQIVSKGESALLPEIEGTDARNRRVEFATKDSTNGCSEE